ncbi:LysR family transcriptional regulator [Thalassococcus sp. S3]|uniref:LysR family transcriptional regulator n=1 Tax=Thalassococcus sp. S3 TaxID=2017482 RepID=UPI0010240140|nr:LysR family transcriptional regulator [Thalassococcus sp. S3]QBF30213.1 LysR family transcriptional regulator [Thalassococcus sp. S3]
MPLRYTLRQLEYFVAAGEYGSIAAASDKLNVSSPSISASISQLEAEFGLSLFVRKRAHGLTLTDAGEKLLAQSKIVLQSAAELNNLAGAMSGSVQGPLRLGCLLTFAQIVVPRLRSDFEASYRKVKITQYEMNQSEIFSALRRAEIDIALSYDLNIPSDLEYQPIIELPPYVLISPDHHLADRERLFVEDLSAHPLVLLDLPHSAEYFLSFFSKAGTKPIIGERTRDMAVMRSLVANGYGYSIANVRPLNDLSPDGRSLKFIPLEGDVRPMRLGLIMAKGAATNISVRAFMDHCTALIKGKQLPGLNCA